MEHSPVVAHYLRYADARRHAEREDEIALVDRARRGEAQAVDQLVRQHLAFVIGRAMEFRGRGVPFEDLISEGCLGLLKAIRRFDSENGARFMTYAAFWVRKAMLEALADQSRMVRVPRYQREKRQSFPREVRLDDRLGPEGQVTVGEALADVDTPLPSRTMLEREAVGRMRRELRSLSPREQAVLASRFGLGGGRAMTLHEVGTHLDISRERVRQIESDALGRLRRAL